ncbi:hypothetical protein CRG98_001968 [Punica granatum]|uniref:Integrase catalytic domain-containing protein n=1 Tax=Punica granatum TaxID=22663 RepID=A0A2I0LAE3_PUNGR|nr:hypothetical protein CRG98_001968 [Punica granatum]
MKNQFANALATLASMVSITKENLIEPLKFEISKGLAHYDVIEAVDGKPWYADIKHFLQTGQFPAFTKRHDWRTLRRIAAHYFLSGETLYRRSFDTTLLRCVDDNEAQRLMEEVHEGNCGPHMNGLTLAKKIMQLDYFWSTRTKSKHCSRSCTQWRLHGPFQCGCMDIIGPVNPKASNGHLFILVAIDYFTKWIEAVTLTSVTTKAVARFLECDIIALYGVLATLIRDNVKNLNNKLIDELCAQFKI